MNSICSKEDNLKIISPFVSKIFNSAFKKNNIKIVRWLLTSKLSSNISSKLSSNTVHKNDTKLNVVDKILITDLALDGFF